MLEENQFLDITNNVQLPKLYEIAKVTAQIGNEILKNNYNKIQTI